MRECVIGVDKYMYAMYVYWGITGVPRVFKRGRRGSEGRRNVAMCTRVVCGRHHE